MAREEDPTRLKSLTTLWFAYLHRYDGLIKGGLTLSARALCGHIAGSTSLTLRALVIAVMTTKTPVTLASLIASEARTLDESDVLQFDARYDRPTHGMERRYPTPRAMPIYDDPNPVTRGLYNRGRKHSIDLIRLPFHPDFVKQFVEDQYYPNFEPVRTPGAIAFNKWRRDITLQQGCENLSWRICDEPFANVILLFVGNAQTCPFSQGHR